MGFFDSITSAYNWIANKATDATHWISEKVSSVYDKGVSVVETIHQDARDLVSGAGGIIRDTESTYSGIVNNLVDKGAGTVQSLGHDAEHAVSNVGNALSMPLVLMAAAAAGVGLLMFSKK